MRNFLRSRRSVLPRRRGRFVAPRLEQLEHRIVFALSSTPLPFNPAGTAHFAADLNAPNDFQLYQVQLQAGDVVTATVNSQPSGGALQSNLRIFDATGRPMALDAQQGGDARLTFQAPRSGNYLVGVSSAGDDVYDPSVATSGKGGATTGLYTLDLQRQTNLAFTPDLAGASFRLQTNTAAYGDTLEATFTVDNRGGSVPPDTNVQVLLSTDNLFGPSSVVLATFALPSLGPGKEFTSGVFAMQLPDPAQATAAGLPASGPVYVGLRIDSEGVVPELNPHDQSGVHAGEDWQSLTVVTPVAANGSNNTQASAQQLDDPNNPSDPNIRVSGDLDAGQTDWYQLTVPANGNVQLTATVTASSGSTLVPLLTLAQQDGTVLIQSDSSLVQNLPPGTYLVQVSTRSGAGDYQLTLSTVPASEPSKPLSTSTGFFSASGVAVADVNGDGKPDLIVLSQGSYNFYTQSYGDGTVSVLLGNGDGTFGTPQAFDAGGYSPYSVVVADINGDGKPDLVVLNKGRYEFNSQTYADTYQNGNVSVLLGNGDGTFGSPQIVNDSYSPQSLAVADLNGDGKPDLIVVNKAGPGSNNHINDNGSVSVLLGNGDGTFGPPQTFDVGTLPYEVAVADLNGDGKPDLIAVNWGKYSSDGTQVYGDNVSVLLGNGDGTFGSPQTLDDGYNPISVAVADVTGDGKNDLVVINYGPFDPTTKSFGSKGVSVFLGNDDGTFPSTKTTTITGGFLYSMTVADVNGDGNPDLVLSNRFGGQVGVMLGSGDGTFQDPQTSLPLPFTNGISNPFSSSGLVVADLNGDSKPDIVAVGNDFSDPVVVMLGNGDGTFQNPASNANKSGTNSSPSVTVSTVTDDGAPDIITSGSSPLSPVSLLLGNDDGTFQIPQTLTGITGPVTVADVNGDGKPDIIEDDKGVVFLGNGDGTFQPLRTRIGKGQYQYHVLAAVALDGDGDPDLLATYYDYKDHSTNLVEFINDGGGTFQPAKQIAAFQNVNVYWSELNVTEADLNGDGKPDLIVSYENYSDHSASISVLINSGGGTFQTAKKVATFQNCYGGLKVLDADLSGDGKPPDLIVSYNDKNDFKNGNFNFNYSYHRSINVVLNDGNGAFQSPQLITSGYTDLLGVADLNGDGPPDLATTYIKAWHYGNYSEYYTAGVSVLLGNGDGTFQPAGVPAPVEFSGNSASVINVEGDGAPELVLNNAFSYSYANGFSQGVAVLQGDGKGSFEPAQVINGYSSVAAVADLTGDGTDIITQSYGGGLRVLLSNPEGSFTPAPSSAAEGQRNVPYMADLTGDGMEDSVVLNSAGAILFRKGLPGADDSFAPPVTLNGPPNSSTPTRPARDLTVLHTAQGIAIATADSANPASKNSGKSQPEYTVSLYRVADDATKPGGISYQRTTAFTTDKQPTRIVAADLTGDGLDDIILADATDDSIQIAFQQSDGNFKLSRTLTTGGSPSDITVADFNGDGLPDIAVSDQDTGEVTVFLNDATHSFKQSYTYSAGAGLDELNTSDTGTASVFSSPEQTVSLAAGDFTGNGSNDLVVLNSGSDSLSVLANDGQGGFANPTAALTFPTSDGTKVSTQAQQVITGHFHGPGTPTDLAVLMKDLGQVWIYTGNGDGTFRYTFSIAAGSQPTGINVVPDPQTGFEDLLIGDSYGDVLRLQGKGDGTFQVAGRRTSLSVQDLSNGQTDVLVADQQNDSITIQAPTSASSQITPVVTLADGSNSTLAPGAVYWAMLDKNSSFYDAIVVASGGNEVLVYRGTGYDASGHPTFAAPVSYPVGTNPASVTVQDINDDGVPDLIVANQGSNDVSLIFGSYDSNGNWVGTAGPRLKSGGSGPVAAQAVFPTGGQPELVVTNGQSGTLAVLPGVGNGFFNDKAPQIINLPGNPVITQGPSFFGSTNSGVLLTATGQLIGINYDDLSSGFQTEFTPPQGEQIVADQALANGQVVAVLSSGTVEDLEPAGGGGLTAFSTFVPLTGIPSEPSALAVLQEESRMQVLVSAAGGDQVFTFSISGPTETELPPQTPTGPVVDVTPLTGEPLIVVATLTADVGLPAAATTTLVGNLAAVEAAEAAETELLNLGLTAQGSGSPAFALGLLTHLLTVTSTEDLEGEEVVVQGPGPAVIAVPPRSVPDSLDLENLLRDLDLYQPPPNPERPSSISRRPGEKPKEEVIARPWALDAEMLRADLAVPAEDGGPPRWSTRVAEAVAVMVDDLEAPPTRAALCDAVLVQSPSSWDLESRQLFGLAGLTLWPWPGYGFGSDDESQTKQKRQLPGVKPRSSPRDPKKR